MNSNAYYRSRLTAMNSLIDSLKGDAVHDQSEKRSKFTSRELLKSGYVTPEVKSLLDETIASVNNTDNSPLNFVEITTLNTWFAMHPEKICGDEFVSTSINFPLQIKAGANPTEYIQRKVRDSLVDLKSQRIGKEYEKAKRIKILKLKAKALLLLKL